MAVILRQASSWWHLSAVIVQCHESNVGRTVEEKKREMTTQKGKKKKKRLHFTLLVHHNIVTLPASSTLNHSPYINMDKYMDKSFTSPGAHLGPFEKQMTKNKRP